MLKEYVGPGICQAFRDRSYISPLHLESGNLFFGGGGGQDLNCKETSLFYWLLCMSNQTFMSLRDNSATLSSKKCTLLTLGIKNSDIQKSEIYLRGICGFALFACFGTDDIFEKNHSGRSNDVNNHYAYYFIQQRLKNQGS